MFGIEAEAYECWPEGNIKGVMSKPALTKQCSKSLQQIEIRLAPKLKTGLNCDLAFSLG